MLFEPAVPGQRFLVPEVVQTSAMDCGPAALKAVLDGFSIPVSLGRLREACQTDVDGTSIDTLEEIAVQLGLQAEQVMIPADHLILLEAQAVPAIAVVRLPSGFTHFLVIWGTFGHLLQVMDPATGRRWPTWKQFLNELYIHTFPVPAQAWREWAGTQEFLGPLHHRLRNLKVDEAVIERIVGQALQDTSWHSLAALDAATRMLEAIVRSKGIAAGEQAGKVLEKFFELNRVQKAAPLKIASLEDKEPVSSVSGLQIPDVYWSVLPERAPGEQPPEVDKPEMLLLRGAVLVRFQGRREPITAPQPLEQPQAEQAAPLSPDLEAALQEPASHPEREVWNSLKEDGLLTPSILAVALGLSTFSVLVEALLLQGVIRIGQRLSLVSQRVWAVAILLAFVLAPLLLEFPITSTVLRMGRRLETRLRIAFLEKIPRLGDRYFHSRLTSDMTQRAYDLRQLRTLPYLGTSLLRTCFQLILTALGVIWLDPISAPLAIAGTVFFIAFSFFTQPILEERDLRMRTHLAGLSRFYLDALIGLVPAKTHGAERAMRRQHELQLYEWVQSGRRYYNVSSYIQGVGALLYSGFSILIILNYIKQGGQSGEILLLFYWTLNLPVLGQSLAEQIKQYPMLRNRILRLLEPIGAPDEENTWFPEGIVPPGEDQPASTDDLPPDGSEHTAIVHNGIVHNGIVMENVSVQAGGNTILRDINLQVKPGEHIAIVGPSGAGKSSLIGLLLGWHRPSQGHIYVDGKLLDGKLIHALRREMAWVDPAVQLWNRSLYDNLRYGIEHNDGSIAMGKAIQRADLFDVLDRLPEGLKTSLGEGGGLVSGGEGQRVRLGRAMLRPNIRLALLDEPFRGLDRDRRRQLLAEARQHWKNATLMCITHDVSETLSFEHVVVIENGGIVEDGSPAELAAQPDSRYRALLNAEEAVRQSLWSSARWRRFSMEGGRLSNPPAVEASETQTYPHDEQTTPPAWNADL